MIKIFTNDKHKLFIPILSILIGVIVCVLCYTLTNNILPKDTNFADNLLKGILCGLSATGLHQLLTNLNTFNQSKPKNKTHINNSVINLKPTKFNKISNSNPNEILSPNKISKNNNQNNLNNYINSQCLSCPYYEQREPEHVEEKTPDN